MCWNGWECVGLVWKALKCYSVQKSCEKSTKCPYRFVFKSWLVMCSLAMFYFKILLLFCYKHPHDSHVSNVLKSCQMKPCHRESFLDVFGQVGPQYKRCVWGLLTHHCVFDPWPCYFTESEKKPIQKGTLVYFVKLKIWSPLSITCKKKT